MKVSRSFFLLAALAAAAPVLGQDFARVNNLVITRDEYIRALEQVPVTLPGASGSVEAGRLVLDQLVAKKIVLDEAAKRGVLPTDADVQKRYDLQKRLVEAQMPGRSLESLMEAQGATPKLIKDEMRYQMAETNLVAKEIGISEDEVKKAYESAKGQIGLPERAQLRVVAPQSAGDFGEAQKLLQAKTPFAKVAQQFNSPSLRASSGLMPQPIPITAMPPAWQNKVKQMAAGSVFGPVEWPSANKNQPPARMWIRIEKTYPALVVPYDEAKPLVKEQLVKARLADPKNDKNDKLQQLIARRKIEAKFQASDPRHQALWEELRRRASQAQPAQTSASPTR